MDELFLIWLSLDHTKDYILSLLPKTQRGITIPTTITADLPGNKKATIPLEFDHPNLIDLGSSTMNHSSSSPPYFENLLSAYSNSNNSKASLISGKQTQSYQPSTILHKEGKENVHHNTNYPKNNNNHHIEAATGMSIFSNNTSTALARELSKDKSLSAGSNIIKYKETTAASATNINTGSIQSKYSSPSNITPIHITKTGLHSNNATPSTGILSPRLAPLQLNTTSIASNSNNNNNIPIQKPSLLSKQQQQIVSFS